MSNGRLLHMPTGAAPWDESSLILAHMRVARRVWLIEYAKPRANQRPSHDDINFMREVLGIEDGR